MLEKLVRHFVGLLGRGSARQRPTKDSTSQKRAYIVYIHALNGIQTHDPSVRADSCQFLIPIMKYDITINNISLYHKVPGTIYIVAVEGMSSVFRLMPKKLWHS